jgi:hypothetical protein
VSLDAKVEALNASVPDVPQAFVEHVPIRTDDDAAKVGSEQPFARSAEKLDRRGITPDDLRMRVERQESVRGLLQSVVEGRRQRDRPRLRSAHAEQAQHQVAFRVLR